MDDGAGFLPNINTLHAQKNIMPCISSMLQDSDLKEQYKNPQLQNNLIVLVGQIVGINNNPSNSQTVVDIDDGFGIIQFRCLKRAEHSQTDMLDGINTIMSPYVQVVGQIIKGKDNETQYCYLTGKRFTELSSHDMIINHFLSVTKALLIQQRKWDDDLRYNPNLQNNSKMNGNGTQNLNNNLQHNAKFDLSKACGQMLEMIRQHNIQNFDMESFDQYFGMNLTKDQKLKSIDKLIREGLIYQEPGTNKFAVTDD